MDQLDLTTFFKTRLQSQDFSSRLSRVISQIYSNDFNLENALQEQYGIEKKDKFIALLRDHNVATQSPPQLKDFMDKVLKEVLALPVLTLTLAFEPKQENLAAFSEWFLLNIRKQILFDIKVDPTIIGGSLVAFEGKFIDGSVKSIFEKMLDQAFTSEAAPPIPAAHPKIIPTQIENISIGR